MTHLRVVAVIALTLALAGCVPQATGGPTSSVPTPSASTATSSPTPTAAPPAAVPACTRDNVTTTYVPTDNSAGHFHGVINFSNRLDTPCSMNGYPAVWFDNPEAQSPIGAQASFDPASTPATVVLQPGGILQAALTITDAGFIDCDHTTSNAFLVAAPKDGPTDLDADIQHVSIDPTQACLGNDAPLLVVGAVTVG